MELLTFLKEYISSPGVVGALVPSGARLANLVTDAARVSDARVIVEFGPGTGVFTEVIAKKMPKDAQCLAIELQEDFVKIVKERCPTVTVFHESATNVSACLAKMGLDKCDCIVSGLPFAIFEDDLQNAILDAAFNALKPGGVFVTFTYFLAHLMPKGRALRRKLLQHFTNVERTRIEWLNVFPAFAYRAIKAKE